MNKHLVIIYFYITNNYAKKREMNTSKASLWYIYLIMTWFFKLFLYIYYHTLLYISLSYLLHNFQCWIVSVQPLKRLLLPWCMDVNAVYDKHLGLNASVSQLQDLLTDTVSCGLSMSDSIFSFCKCSMTLKEILFSLTLGWTACQKVTVAGIRISCWCLICLGMKVLLQHWWKEGDWMVNASKPPISGSLVERTWRRLRMMVECESLFMHSR